MVPTITLIEAGEVLTPDPAGVKSVLTTGQVICKVGQVDAKRLAALDLPVVRTSPAIGSRDVAYYDKLRLDPADICCFH